MKPSVKDTEADEAKLAQEARRSSVDAEFERATARVLEKNRELYRRLA